jgi:hypothetical protein
MENEHEMSRRKEKLSFLDLMLKTTGLSTSDVAEEVENFMFAGAVGQNVEKVGFTLDSVSKVSST